MTGRVFAEPVKVNEDVPKWIVDEVLNNVDMMDHDVQVFMRQWFMKAFDKGHACVLVESPKAAGVKTQADQKAAGARPYGIILGPERILGWKTNPDGSLRQLRVTFEREEDDGDYGTTCIPQVRVYEMRNGKVAVDVYEEQKTDDPMKKQWKIVAEQSSVIDLPAIPVVTFYTRQTGFMTSEPPLLQLAYLNIQHWQVKSHLDSLLNVAMIPILVMLGVDETDKIVIGERYAIKLPAAGSDMKYVEHTGKAIESGQKRLEEIKTEMRDAGAKLLTPGTGRSSGSSASKTGAAMTATEASEQAASDNSLLGMMVEDFKDAMESFLDIVASYRSETDGGTVEPQPNLDPDQQPIESGTFLLSMANSGKLSSSTLFDEIQKRGMISEDLTWDEEEIKIQEEMAKLGLAANRTTGAAPAPGPAGKAATPAPPAAPVPAAAPVAPQPSVES